MDEAGAEAVGVRVEIVGLEAAGEERDCVLEQKIMVWREKVESGGGGGREKFAGGGQRRDEREAGARSVVVVVVVVEERGAWSVEVRGAIGTELGQAESLTDSWMDDEKGNLI
jgi:hypothetical protein